MADKTTSSPPTIRDVAAQAGVSVGTVSRVLNGKSVSNRVLALVNTAIQKLGYSPNAVAQSMRTKSTRAVGLIINDISNPLFSGIAKSLDDCLSENEYSLLIASTNNDSRRERVIVESLKQRRVDGLVIAVTDERDEGIKSVLRNVEFPIVLLDRDLDISADSIWDEHASGMKKALRYLFDLGHQDVALITGDDSIRPGRERARGFREAFKENGRQVPENRVIQGRLNSQFGYEEASRLFESSNRPSAVIAGGNQILSGILRAIRQRNIRVPEDLSLISCDEVDIAALMDPPITVISRDIVQVGQAAANILLRRINGDVSNSHSRQFIATELVVRESCAPLH